MSLKCIARSLTPLIGWAIPIGVAAVCWVSFGCHGRPATAIAGRIRRLAGTVFAGKSVELPRQGNWETFVQQINQMGLFFVWPVALLGLVSRMPWEDARAAVTLILWVVPCALLYMCYYWVPGWSEHGFLYAVLSDDHPRAAAGGAVAYGPRTGTAGASLQSESVVADRGDGGESRRRWRACSVTPARRWGIRIVAVPGGGGDAAGHRRGVAVEGDQAGLHFAAAVGIGAITLAISFVNLWNITPSLENSFSAETALRGAAGA